jgi:murein DD-endopeptidase MepM/ murein hydrolase activator NlpD
MEALHKKQQVKKRRTGLERLKLLLVHGTAENDAPFIFPGEQTVVHTEMGLFERFHPQKAAVLGLVLILSIALAVIIMGKSGNVAVPPLDPVTVNSVRASLLSYSGQESANQGSGAFMLPEGAIINSVSSREYLLQRGDTLSEIAGSNGLDVGTLIAFNQISDVRKIFAGTTIRIPNVDGVPYTVRSGDSLASISEKFAINLNYILDANDLQTELISAGDQLFIPGGKISEYDYKKAMGTLFIYPTGGRLTSPFGYRNDPFTGVRSMHYGVDLAAPVGTSILSTMAGQVIAVGDRPAGYGRYIVVRHQQGFQSLYGHLSRILVRKGQYVSQGQKIGEMGSSGRSTGPHLHFSLYRNNVPINPLNGYLYR